MKRKAFIFCLITLLLAAGIVVAQNVSNYMEQGGARWVIGGSADVISGGEIDIESGGALKLGGTQMTSDATELNLLDGVTAGSITASKAVTRDSGKRIPVFGASVAATGSAQGDAASLTGGVNIVTASDGTKGVILPTAVVGMDVRVINSVSNATLPVYPATGAQINGGGANTAFTLGPGQEGTFHCTALLTWYVVGQAAVTSTVTELNYVDVTAAGTAEASKALVLDSNKDAGGVRYFGVTNVVSEAGNGAVVTGVTATEYGDGVIHKTILTLALSGGNAVTVTREAGDDSGHSATKIYDMPEGRVLVLGVTADLAFDVSGSANISDTGSGDVSMGTTGTSDVTLDSTDVDLLPSTGMTDPFVAGVGAAAAALAASAQFDGTTTAKDVYINTAWDAGDVTTGDGAVEITGTATITWINLGDY